MKKILFLSVLLASLLASSCQKAGLTPEPTPSPAVSYLYAGDQGDNKFQLWIWIYEDESVPALIRSGMCRYVDGAFIDTDEERLDYRLTKEGFTLTDPVTGEIRYTATPLESSLGQDAGPGQSLSQAEAIPPYRIHIAWTHSPGPTWDHYAAEKAWQQEMDLCLQVFLGDDIVN